MNPWAATVVVNALAAICSAAYAVARGWPERTAALVALVGAAATAVLFGPALVFWLVVAYVFFAGDQP